MWRFACAGPGEGFTVEMPAGAVIRHFGAKDRRPHFWAEVDPTAPTEPRVFAVLATGYPYPDDAIYRGTVVIEGLVWHLIEGPS